MKQEWRFYNVGGAKNAVLVRLLLNSLLFIKKINLLTLRIRLGEEHRIPTLMIVGSNETA